MWAGPGLDCLNSTGMGNSRFGNCPIPRMGGTGKTVVARMVGKLLVEMGVIKKAVQRDVGLEFGLFRLNSISHQNDSIRF